MCTSKDQSRKIEGVPYKVVFLTDFSIYLKNEHFFQLNKTRHLLEKCTTQVPL